MPANQYSIWVQCANEFEIFYDFTLKLAMHEQVQTLGKPELLRQYALETALPWVATHTKCGGLSNLYFECDIRDDSKIGAIRVLYQKISFSLAIPSHLLRSHHNTINTSNKS
jgi:hypothetical protein